jgi:hypothetical protein
MICRYFYALPQTTDRRLLTPLQPFDNLVVNAMDDGGAVPVGKLGTAR